MFETFDIEEVAGILNASEATILLLADSGDLPGAKIGKSWVFESNLIHQYLLEQIRIQTAERRQKRISPDHSIHVKTTLSSVKDRSKHRYPELPEVNLTRLN